MIKRAARIGLLAGLCLVLVSISALTGCGGAETERQTITIGWLGDATGPAVAAIGPVYDGLTDYIKMIEDDNLLPGLEIKVTTYDTRTDYGRVPVGYVSLRDRGAQLILVPNPGESEVVSTRVLTDKIVLMTTAELESLQDNPWVFFTMTSLEKQTIMQMQWLLEDWDSETMGRLPRVGHVGSTLAASRAVADTLADFLSANPGLVEWKGDKLMPTSTASWAGEITALSDCDYVMLSTLATQTATFINEGRTKGFGAKLLSGTSAIPGYWNLIRGTVSAEKLTGLYHLHIVPWVGDNEFINELKTGISRYRAQSYQDLQLAQSAYHSGWQYGIILHELLERLMESDAFDGGLTGSEVRDFILETDFQPEGWGNRWTLTEQQRTYATTGKFYEWNIAQAAWVPVSDWLSYE